PTDRTGGGPTCIAESFEIHIEDADGVFTGHDPIADLVPGAILDHCGVADRDWSRMDFPDEAIGGRLERKISDVAWRVWMHRVGTRREKNGRKLTADKRGSDRGKRLRGLPRE